MTCRRCSRPARFLFTVASREEKRCLDMATGSGYCEPCARKRQRELRNSDRRSYNNRQAKVTGQNLHADDCTLIAVSHATGLPYTQVETLAKKVGYRPGRGGIHFSDWVLRMLVPAAEKRGRSVEPLRMADYGGYTVGDFVADHPTGRFAIRAPGHAMAVVNGKLINGDFYAGMPVHGAWEVV